MPKKVCPLKTAAVPDLTSFPYPPHLKFQWSPSSQTAYKMKSQFLALHNSPLKEEAARSSETSVSAYNTTWEARKPQSEVNSLLLIFSGFVSCNNSGNSLLQPENYFHILFFSRESSLPWLTDRQMLHCVNCYKLQNTNQLLLRQKLHKLSRTSNCSRFILMILSGTFAILYRCILFFSAYSSRYRRVWK